MLTVDQARQQIFDTLVRLPSEGVPLERAAGRVLAAPVVARRTLPPWDNSAMDGFAVRAAELPGTLPIRGVIPAGAAPDATLAVGGTMRIMTGAPVPAGADAVVMREHVDDGRDTATFSRPARQGQHIRRAGEDVRVGDAIMDAGTILGAGEIGMLAAQGITDVEVSRSPRVAILSTGDELVPADVEPGPGQIVNSNAYALAAQVREAGGTPIHLGIARDDRAASVEKLREGLRADVLLSSGGVSVGDFDFVKEAFSDLGVDMGFWKVSMKPGKPLAFGVSEGRVPVFGLPGNPVSSMVSFEIFARPALLQMQGAARTERPRAQVVLTVPYAKKAGRTHFVRAILTRDGAILEAKPHPRQGSGMLSSMIGIDALVEIPIEVGDVEAGTTLPAHLLRAV